MKKYSVQNKVPAKMNIVVVKSSKVQLFIKMTLFQLSFTFEQKGSVKSTIANKYISNCSDIKKTN